MADYISRNDAVIIANYAADEHPYDKNRERPETYSDYNQGWSDACDYIRAKLDAEKPADVVPVRNGRWIPCSERLPDVKQRILFWAASSETIYAGYYRYVGPNGTVWFLAGKSIYGAKYWMPLPEPPEKGGDENAAD